MSTVDLNTFTWFYWTAPFDTPPLPRIQVRRSLFSNGPTMTLSDIGNMWLGDVSLKYTRGMSKEVRQSLRLQPGDCYVGRQISLVRCYMELMRALSLYGFFVCREQHVSAAAPHTRQKSMDTDSTHHVHESALSRCYQRIEIIRVLDNWEDDLGAWYWCVKGSGVFLQTREWLGAEAQRFRAVGSRSELSLFANKTILTKEELDRLDGSLPKWMRGEGLRGLYIHVAHGAPELLLIGRQSDDHLMFSSSRSHDGTIQTHIPVEKNVVRLEDDDVLHPKELLSTLHTATHQVNPKHVAGIDVMYITTGDTMVIHKKRVFDDTRVLTVVYPSTRQPVWSPYYSHVIVNEIVECIDDTSKLYRAIYKSARERARTHCGSKGLNDSIVKSQIGFVLDQWIPIHVRNVSTTHEDLDTLCTPLAFSVLMGNHLACSFLLGLGASLRSTCPMSQKGHEDPSDLDVAHFLKQALRHTQPDVMSRKRLWQTISQYACAEDLSRLRDVGLL